MSQYKKEAVSKQICFETASIQFALRASEVMLRIVKLLRREVSQERSG